MEFFRNLFMVPPDFFLTLSFRVVAVRTTEWINSQICKPDPRYKQPHINYYRITMIREGDR
jgi:hypothetical protein